MHEDNRARLHMIQTSTVTPDYVRNAGLREWVTATAQLTRPERIVWCDGSDGEYRSLTEALIRAGTLIPLNESKRPGCFLARSDPADVARVEDRTFICSVHKQQAGPTNNWVEPGEMRATLHGLFDGAMRGRTLYVVPFSMGPIGSPLAKLGVQITASPYAVLSMQIMTRLGPEALAQIEPDPPGDPAVHSAGYPLVDPDGAGRPDVPWPSN